MERPRFSCAGIVLCGGMSKRMGVPKANLLLDGRPLLVHVVDVLRSVVDDVTVVSSADQSLPEVNARIVCDEFPFEGPLAGILRGLETLPGSVEAVYVSAVDVPLLRPQWVELILGKLASADIAIPVVGGRVHPLSAGYRLGVRETARRLFAEGERRPTRLLDHHVAQRIEEFKLRVVDTELDSIRNANTPEEFEELVRIHRTRIRSPARSS